MRLSHTTGSGHEEHVGRVRLLESTVQKNLGALELAFAADRRGGNLAESTLLGSPALEPIQALEDFRGRREPGRRIEGETSENDVSLASISGANVQEVLF